MSYGCANSEVVTNSSDNNKISELEKQNQKLNNQIEELNNELQHYSTEKEAFPSISWKVSRFMFALTQNDLDKIAELTEKSVPLFMKDDDIYTTYDDFDLNLTYNSVNETLASWFIQSIELNHDTNQINVLVRPHHLDSNNQSVQEADRYYLKQMRNG